MEVKWFGCAHDSRLVIAFPREVAVPVHFFTGAARTKSMDGRLVYYRKSNEAIEHAIEVRSKRVEARVASALRASGALNSPPLKTHNPDSIRSTDRCTSMLQAAST